MEIAIIAHDLKKELMTQFCIAYCGILSKHNLCATNITAKYISEATGLKIEKLLSVIDVSTPLGKRDDALFELIYSCGLRISEVCNLLMENLHMNEQIILVRGKGDKERIIPFGVRAKEKLKI